MTYAEAVKAVRNKMILSQMEFADFLGVSFGTVNRRENGKFNPTVKAKRKLAPLFEKYNIEVEE
jgi:DNA-binding XRE family transcriptional regulator